MADDTGRCNEANFVEFAVPVPAKIGEENTCAREVENLASQCSSVFAWGRFTNQLYVGTDGTVAPAPLVIGGEYTAVRSGPVPQRPRARRRVNSVHASDEKDNTVRIPYRGAHVVRRS